MSNPYEEYDAINPWDDTDEFDRLGAPSRQETSGPYGGGDVRTSHAYPTNSDDTGNFNYVEDAYAPLVEDGNGLDSTAERLFGDVPSLDPASGGAQGVPGGANGSGGTQQFPKTQVRPFYGVPNEQASQSSPYPASNDQIGGTLVRRRGRGRAGRAAAGDPSNGPSRMDVLPSPAPSPSVGAPPMSRREQRQARKAERRMRKAQMRAQSRQLRPRRRHRFLKTVAVLTAMVVAAYLVVCSPIDRQLAFSSAEQQTVNGKTSFAVPGLPYYVLALGSDAREGDTYSRTDTMMLVRVDLLAGKLTMVSIPRDTMVEIEGYGTQKINAAYAFGGAGGAVQAVSKLTGVPVNHVAVVHFGELADLVDYLGGVTVNVPVDVYDPEHTGLVLDAGLQTLDGQQALAWARTRYGFEQGDFQRQADQRILVEAIMNRLLSLSAKDLPGAVQRIGELIGTDLRCYDLIPLFARMRLGKPVVYSCTLPSTTAMVDGVSYVIVDEQGVQSLMRVVNAGGDPSALGY